MTKLKVGVVGVGALGRHHARILSELPEAELVAVADTSAARGQEIAAKLNCEWVSDYRALVGKVEAVSVVVPTVAHLDVAGFFLKQGLPVLVEKPLSFDVASARQIVELAEAAGVVLQVGHVERFNPAFTAALSCIGKPRYLRCERTSPFTFRSTDIGVTLDLMIHDIDLVNSLVRSPLQHATAFGVGVMGQHEDAVQARLVYENGAIADLTASRISPTVNRTLQVWSSSGCVSVDLQKREVVRYSPSASLTHGMSPVELSQQPGADLEQLKQDVFGKFVKVEQVPVQPGDALTAELQSFLHCVCHNVQPEINGRTALQAMQVADAVLASLKEQRWSVRGDHEAGELRKAG